MFYELTIGVVSVAFSFLTYFSFQDFFRRTFYRNNGIKYDERHDLNGKELLYVSLVRDCPQLHFLLKMCVFILSRPNNLCANIVYLLCKSFREK